ncbi:lysosomal-associated transmembrane protein 4A isoform X1 [Vanessa tameamea]|uniref:Lysosomal-associated transmembrane protein 4A isoform X1 n=1 Tax=Vanessa tameamea TaxID=334116 RepID=A0A8B8IRA5_VANTA|nr:lysosomal-associated transmembrane protein 4A isoform X1 [Vanessa tameamea]XP_047533280.1 lysosomal-associated transmembrane protein 4A isoform X1 [Vanessa atalanta]
MLRFRPKLGTERSKEWRCCFCLHVRTGTILLGTWHLLLHLVALGFLAAIVRDPSLLDELERDTAPVADWSDIGAAMPTPLSNVETRPSPYPQHGPHPRDHSLIYHDVDVGAMVTVCTLAITLMLIYGASRGKPAHLLPFFCLQIFDFAITVLTATGYLCYLRSIHRLVAEARRVPWREQLLSLPAPALALVVLATFLFAVLLKGYCISVVWRCYKYLTMRTHALHSLTPFVISSSGALSPGAPLAPPAPAYSSLLPDYEEAVKQTPPPSYRAATLMAAADPVAAIPPSAEQNQPLSTNTVVMLPQQGTQARV